MKKFTKKQKTIALGLTFVALLLTTFTMGFKYTQKQIRSRVLAGLYQDRAIESGDQVTYSFLNGWNLISFPAESTDISTAKDIIVQASKNQILITTVSMWDGDRWVEFSMRGDQEFGDDFPIERAVGYFIRAHNKNTWDISFNPDTVAEYKYEIKEGWNVIGLPPNMKASTIMDSINTNKESSTEIDRWYSGTWDPYIYRIYEGDKVKKYGNNFQTTNTSGYMIHSLENRNWDPFFK